MKLGPLIALLLISSSISGCLSNEQNESETLQEAEAVDLTLPALIEQCMMFDEMERCWLIHLPTGYERK